MVLVDDASSVSDQGSESTDPSIAGLPSKRFPYVQPKELGWVGGKACVDTPTPEKCVVELDRLRQDVRGVLPAVPHAARAVLKRAVAKLDGDCDGEVRRQEIVGDVGMKRR